MKEIPPESTSKQELEALEELRRKVVEQDANFAFADVGWYISPSLMYLAEHRNWRKVGELKGEMDGSFPQPAASTSSIGRIVLEDRSTRIIKELDRNHSHFYTDTPVAQAITLAGEQAIAWPQFTDQDLKYSGAERFYQGVFSLNQEGDNVRLAPFEIKDEGRVVGLMREVDNKRNLALLMFSDNTPGPDELHQIYSDLVVRAMKMKYPMLENIRKRMSSEEYIRSRITEHTPGQLSDQEMGRQFSWLKDQASEYVKLAEQIIDQDRKLREYLLQEDYARRGGDVRAINTILDQEGEVEVVLDQINLFLDRKEWEADDWHFKRLDIAPWGMNSDTYEVAFLNPDLVASGNEPVVQTVVETLGNYNRDFLGEDWDDLGSTPIRALRFWTAMKAIETAGLSTFRFGADGRMVGENVGNQEEAYLLRAIDSYGGIAVELACELKETVG